MKLQGVPVSPGIAIGRAVIWRNDVEVKEATIEPEEVEREIARLERGVKKAQRQLAKLHQQTREQVGEEEAGILFVHLTFLQDPDFIGEMKRRIEAELVDAATAVQKEVEHFEQLFAMMDDEYIRERATDIRDVGNRLIQALTGQESKRLFQLDDPVIIVGEDLSPSEIVQLPKEFVLGIVTMKGGKTSHSAILARSLGIPTVMALDRSIDQIVIPGDLVIMNGTSGEVWIRPNKQVLSTHQEILAEERKLKQQLEQIRFLPTVTKDGHRIKLQMNVGGLQEMEEVVASGTDGIGLFRSEFLFMNRDRLPSEEEQFIAYLEVVRQMNGKPTVIRTLDIGGDKHLPYLNMPKEMNPFLGYRAIRISLEHLVLFKTQLRAILRASHFGKVMIMFPMISHLEQVRQAKKILRETQEELKNEGIAFDPHLEIGIMIEVPSACMIADALAKEVQFFSIGTNDLVQYVLAVDRMNERIQHLYNYFHPAVIRLIHQVIQAAHRQKIWIGMCGEMASDPQATELLVGLGLDEFSVSANLLQIKQKIRSLSYSEAVQVAHHVLTLNTAQEVQHYLLSRNKEESRIKAE